MSNIVKGMMRKPLVRFVTKRALASVVILIGITLVSFILTQAVPADPALANLGIKATQSQIDTYREVHGLNDPLPQRYLNYLGGLLQGDLGVSQQTHNPVLKDLGRFVPATLELAIGSILIIIVFGVITGTLAAMYRDRWPDYVLRILTLSGISVPVFWLAIVSLYVFFIFIPILPGSGRLDTSLSPPPFITGMFTFDAIMAGQWATFWDALKHLILPSLVLAAPNVAIINRYTRSAVLDVIDQEYVLAGRAQGLGPMRVMVNYVLRAAMPAVLTLIGLLFANVLTGAVLVENIFSWPGLGRYGYLAATKIDLPAIMGVSIFVAVVYLVINFVVDMLYGALDPRMRVTT